MQLNWPTWIQSRMLMLTLFISFGWPLLLLALETPTAQRYGQAQPSYVKIPVRFLLDTPQ